MKHDDIRHKLSEYIDGAVTADEKTIIEEHLASCRECSDALGELQKALQHIRDLEEMDSPPWLTQKIMTRVREEAEHKTGFFRKLFFPLHIKLPIQAVAVLFLTVTAFYISQSIQPAMQIVQAPTEEMTDRSARPDREGLPQSPEYKSLDMQYSYKPVPPPVPQESAPASAAVSENEKRKAEPEAEAAAPQAEEAAPAGKGDTAAPMAGFAARKKSRISDKAEAPTATDEREEVMPLTDQEPALTITVMVQDPEAAGREINKAIESVNGSIISKEPSERGTVFVATLNANKLQELHKELKQIGEVREPEAVPLQKAGQITVRIESLFRH